MSRLIAPFVPLVVALAAAAQQAGKFSCRELPRADAIAIGLVWERGYAGDECAGVPGAAVVVAECRLLRARAKVRGLLASTVHVDRDVSAVLGVVPATAAAQAVEFVQVLLDDTVLPTDDEIALVIARRALVADDAEFLYPGDVLTTYAMRVVGGAPAVAVSTDVAALTPDIVRRCMRAQVPVGGAVAAAEPASLMQALSAIPLRSAMDPDTPAASGGFDVAALRECPSAVHSRLDQPFVMSAFQAPGGARLPAFAVAIEVARSRAGKRFRYGGSELRAHAPFVAWSWLDGEPCVRFFRRGREPTRLAPGERFEADAATEAARTRAELDAFLDDLRTRAPSADEVAAARRTLLTEHGLVIADDRPVGAAMLTGWLLVQMLGPRRGIDAAALATVDAAAAHAALCAVLATDRAIRHDLLPAPRPDRTWPRR